MPHNTTLNAQTSQILSNKRHQDDTIIIIKSWLLQTFVNEECLKAFNSNTKEKL